MHTDKVAPKSLGTNTQYRRHRHANVPFASRCISLTEKNNLPSVILTSVGKKNFCSLKGAVCSQASALFVSFLNFRKIFVKIFTPEFHYNLHKNEISEDGHEKPGGNRSQCPERD